MLRKVALSLAVLTVFGLSAQAQTVDDIIAKYVQARGGMEKLKAVQSTRSTGKMEVGGGLTLPFTVISVRPSKVRIEFTLQGLTGIVAYDGKAGWQLIPFQGKKDAEPMSDEDLKQFSYDSDFDGPLVNYKDKGYKVELAGKEQVEGTDAYKIKVTLKNGDIHYIFLDTDSFLQIEEKAKITVRGAQQDVKTVMGDYKEVEGVMFPFSTQSTVEGDSGGMGGDRKITIEKVEINPKLDNGLFQMPAAKPADEKKPQ
ncbi:MAG: LolA family protein [Blastocatellia bacterium]